MSPWSAGQARRQATCRLDPTQDPKTIDLTPTTGRGQGKNLRGIYQLDGDKLIICVADEPDGARPTEFVSNNEADLWLLGHSSQDDLQMLLKTLGDDQGQSVRIKESPVPVERTDQNLILCYVDVASAGYVVVAGTVGWVLYTWRFRNQA